MIITYHHWEKYAVTDKPGTWKRYGVEQFKTAKRDIHFGLFKKGDISFCRAEEFWTRKEAKEQAKKWRKEMEQSDPKKPFGYKTNDFDYSFRFYKLIITREDL